MVCAYIPMNNDVFFILRFDHIYKHLGLCILAVDPICYLDVMLSLFYCNAAQQSAEIKARDYGFLKEEEADAPLMEADLSHSEIRESSLLLFIEILYDMLYYKLSIMFPSSLLLNCLSCTMLSPSSQFGSHLRTSCATVTALLCTILFCSVALHV